MLVNINTKEKEKQDLYKKFELTMTWCEVEPVKTTNIILKKEMPFYQPPRRLSLSNKKKVDRLSKDWPEMCIITNQVRLNSVVSLY